MNRDNQELEVKFYLSRRGEMEARILSLGARLGDPRVHEINLRFDTPDQSLLETGKLLRLRTDRRARLTYRVRVTSGQGHACGKSLNSLSPILRLPASC